MKGRMYADGGSRGNPGPAGSGAVIYELVDGEEREIARVSEYLGVATNNVAEYNAIRIGLLRSIELGITDLEVRLDSELAVKQINGQYKVKNAGLKPFHTTVKSLMPSFKTITFSHVRREFNKVADSIVNEVIDRSV